MWVRLRVLFASPVGRALAAALLVAVALLAAFRQFVSSHRSRLAAGRRLELVMEVAPYGNALAAALERRLALLDALRAFVQAHWSASGPMHREFNTFAAGLRSAVPGIRALELQPKGINRFVYPSGGNQERAGHNILEDPRPMVREAVRRTMETRSVAISGPYDLRQGGLGIVARLAMFRDDRFWGFVTVVLDLQPLLDEAGLGQFSDRFRFALRTVSGRVFHGSATLFNSHPVIHEVRLPDGYWELAAAPAGGWERRGRFELVMGRVLGAAVIMLSSLIVFLVVERRERSRRQSEDERNRLFELAIDLLCIAGLDGRLQRINPAWERCLGFTREELVSRPFADFVHPDDREATAAAVEELRAGRPVVGFQNRYRTRDGDYRWLEWSSVAIPAEKRIYAAAHDVTAKKSAEQALKESESRLARAQRIAQMGYWEQDLLTRSLIWSDEVYRIFGIEPKQTSLTTDFFLARVHPDDRNRIGMTFDRALSERRPYAIDHRIVRPDGSERVVREFAEFSRDDSGAPVRVLGTIQDITEYKQLEEQLRHSQKMEAIGTLAGGVAHDFNNLLTVILGYTQILLTAATPADNARPALLEIDRAAERAASLTRQLLAFSRKQVLQPEVLSLNSVIAETETMLRRLLPEHIDLITVLDPNLTPVKVDRSQMAQVLLNLVVNARDAMPEGGTLAIETANVELSPGDDVKDYPARPAGPYVRLSVSDSGCGMSPEVRARIFEPFFTTKGPGRGTGLGLSTVYGITEQSGGTITVETAEGHGSRFDILLPASAGPARSGVRAAAVPVEGRETVLVVEDEPALRSLACHILSSCGYNVLEAGSGRDALELSRTYGKPIHLLLTDVVMPGMSGHELAVRLTEPHPHLRVLFMSGYTDERAVAIPNYVQKPFSPEALARHVRSVLD